MLEREWVSIRDPGNDHLRYTFDVSFLLSNYTCVYGAECPGVHPGERDPEDGCCVHGAYLNEDDDPDELVRLVDEELDPSSMQFHATAVRQGALVEDEEGETKTRLVRDGCIFLNRADFDGPAGCALHHLAEERGEHHMTYKPVVCWQVPLHRTVEEHTANDGEPLEEHTIAAFERGHWGPGGAEFGWWCMDDDTAFVGAEPVYRSMEHELREMVGDDVYEELAEFLDGVVKRSDRIRFLPVVG